MANYVLIAGTFHGGWYWDPVVQALTQAGHNIFAPTLSGLGGDHGTNPVNLDTHIQDVIQVIESNNLDKVILVGWSYGGMVITGVANKLSVKVDKLIYLDAQLPYPGESEWDLIPPADRDSMLAQCIDGLSIYPESWLLNYEPRVQPHPLGSKLQKLEFDQNRFDALSKVFIFATEWFHDSNVPSPIQKSYLRAESGLGWQVARWPHGHDLVREVPDKVVELLLIQANL